MSVILEHVSKAYGRQKALDDIGFRLEEGEICGFLGPNGAGKSTTMKIITGCLNDYQGEVRIKEMNLRENPLKIKAIIGYLPEQNPLYPDLYIREYLLHVARLYSDPGRTDDGTRSEPTGRDQAFDQRNRKKEDGVVIDPYYAGGRSDL